MWKPGDLVKQRASIFRVDEVGGNPMIVIEVLCPSGEDGTWPTEVITMFDGRLYHWNPDALETYSPDLPRYPTIHGGTSWD